MTLLSAYRAISLAGSAGIGASLSLFVPWEYLSCADRCEAATSPVFFRRRSKTLSLVTHDDIEPGIVAKIAEGRLVIGESRLDSRGKATEMCVLALLRDVAFHRCRFRS